MNLKLKDDDDMSYHIAKMETKFSRLVTINDWMSQAMRVATLVALLSHPLQYIATTASIITLRKKEGTRKFLSVTYIEKQQRQKMKEKEAGVEAGTLPASSKNGKYS